LIDKKDFHPAGQHLFFPGSITVGEILRAYAPLQKAPHGDWVLLVVQVGEEFRVGSFSSLLPYLTGRTPHVVHDVGACHCGGLNYSMPELLQEALSTSKICARRAADLPLLNLPTVERDAMTKQAFKEWVRQRAPAPCGVTENGVFYGLDLSPYRGGARLPF
jgi:hypothetical protein